MALNLIGNDFGDLSRMQLAEEAQRQQASQYALSQLMSALNNLASRRERASEFDRTLRLGVARDAEGVRQFNEAMKLNREQNAARSSTAGNRVADFVVKSALQDAETTGDFDGKALAQAGADPLTVGVVEKTALNTRAALTPIYDRRVQAFNLGNQIAGMNAVADETEKNEKATGRNWFARINPLYYLSGAAFTQPDPNAADPKKVAGDIRTRAGALNNALSAFLSDKEVAAGLRQNPQTKRMEIDKLPDWYLAMRTNAPAIRPPQSSRTGTAAPMIVNQPVAPSLTNDVPILSLPTATNPQTGQRLIFKDGTWQPISN